MTKVGINGYRIQYKNCTFYNLTGVVTITGSDSTYKHSHVKVESPLSWKMPDGTNIEVSGEGDFDTDYDVSTSNVSLSYSHATFSGNFTGELRIGGISYQLEDVSLEGKVIYYYSYENFVAEGTINGTSVSVNGTVKFYDSDDEDTLHEFEVNGNVFVDGIGVKFDE